MQQRSAEDKGSSVEDGIERPLLQEQVNCASFTSCMHPRVGVGDVFFFGKPVCMLLLLHPPPISKGSDRFLRNLQTETSKSVRLGFISGVVPKAKAASFERILFRATRGNMFLKQALIQDAVTDPATGEKVSALARYHLWWVM